MSHKEPHEHIPVPPGGVSAKDATKPLTEVLPNLYSFFGSAPARLEATGLGTEGHEKMLNEAIELSAPLLFQVSLSPLAQSLKEDMAGPSRMARTKPYLYAAAALGFSWLSAMHLFEPSTTMSSWLNTTLIFTNIIIAMVYIWLALAANSKVTLEKMRAELSQPNADDDNPIPFLASKLVEHPYDQEQIEELAGLTASLIHQLSHAFMSDEDKQLFKDESQEAMNLMDSLEPGIAAKAFKQKSTEA